jgi:hypothetical protein
LGLTELALSDWEIKEIGSSQVHHIGLVSWEMGLLNVFGIAVSFFRGMIIFMI